MFVSGLKMEEQSSALPQFFDSETRERESEFIVYMHNCMYLSYVTLKIKYGAGFED